MKQLKLNEGDFLDEDRTGKSGKIYVYPYTWREDKSPPYKTEYGDVGCVAVSEDGHGLGGHLSSNKEWAVHDMGITSDWKHNGYHAYYPAGYELIWLDTHEDLPEEVVKAIEARNKEVEDAKVQHV